MGKRFDKIRDAEEFLSQIPQFSGAETGFKYGVERARLLLEFAGHPEKYLKIIHVAGSNGKGSVCALLDNALRSAGFKTGLFTSPHLICMRERIRFTSEMIGEGDFLRLLEDVCEIEERVREKYPDFKAAYFEYFFVIALLYFKEMAADAVILDTGLGGRLDATNACEDPVLCVITSISLEHTRVLGESVEEIAAEKAGIIRGGAPVAAHLPKGDSVKRILEKRAAKAGSAVTFFDKNEISVNVITDENIDFSLKNGYYRNVTVTLPMPAIYEAYNAGLALTALAVLAESERLPGLDARTLELRLPDICAGLEGLRWPGRMECVAPGVYMDGAHNAEGIEAFLESVSGFAQGRCNVLLFAVSDDKDRLEMIRLLCESGLFCSVVVTAADEARGAAAETVARAFEAHGFADVCTEGEPEAAYRKALATPHDYVFCTGSLFLAGRVGELKTS